MCFTKQYAKPNIYDTEPTTKVTRYMRDLQVEMSKSCVSDQLGYARHTSHDRSGSLWRKGSQAECVCTLVTTCCISGIMIGCTNHGISGTVAAGVACVRLSHHNIVRDQVLPDSGELYSVPDQWWGRLGGIKTAEATCARISRNNVTYQVHCTRSGTPTMRYDWLWRQQKQHVCAAWRATWESLLPTRGKEHQVLYCTIVHISTIVKMSSFDHWEGPLQCIE